CKAVDLFSGPFVLKNWVVSADPIGTVPTGSFYDPEITVEVDALPYRLKVNSYYDAMPVNSRLGESSVPLAEGYLQDFSMEMIASEDMSFDFGWTFDVDPLTGLMTAQEQELNSFYTYVDFYISLNGTEYPVIEDGDLLPVSNQRNLAPVILSGSRDGILSIPLVKGDSFAIRAEWSSATRATLTLYGPNIVSTSEHECAAYSYIPPLAVKDDWGGAKQVKAIVEGNGTYIMTYDQNDSCWISHERVKLPKNGEYYKVVYEAYDSCHNASTDSCYIYVKDRIKPVPVMDKSVTVSLSDKKVWLEAEAFNEGSSDNCGVNFILIRRSDWQESCIDLCDSVIPCYIDDHQDTLWVAALSQDKYMEPVEAHYAKTLQWLCEDETPCGELIYNAWQYHLMKYATLHCNPHLYGASESYFKEKFTEAFHSSASFRDKFDSCQPDDPNQSTADRFSPFHPDLVNLVDLYEQLGGGWSDAIAFDCTDACQYVTVEMLVMDYWCNWTKIWNEVKVEDKNPPQVVKNVKDNETISCKSYHDEQYHYPGINDPVGIDFIVEQAKQGAVAAYDLLDAIFGGYKKAWRDSYGNFVDIDGEEIPQQIMFIDSTCICVDEIKQVYIYDDHLGYYWKDSLVTNCYYQADTQYFYQGIVQVNCQENVHCKQEIWSEFDHCGQGYLYRKFKIWQSCSDSFYNHDLYTDSVYHPIDTVERIQRIFVGKECQLNKFMFEVPGDLTVEACGLQYDDLGNVVGNAGPENTGSAKYKLEDDCRIVGIAHKDKVFKIVEGKEACYKILRTWYFADWCGTDGAPINKNWWEDYTLVLDSCVQVILVIDKVPPVCEIKGPVISGETIEMGSCSYTLNVDVKATDVCGLTEYAWQLYNLTNPANSFIQKRGNGMLSGEGEEQFPVTVSELQPGNYRLLVHLEDECNNENSCEYLFDIVKVKKPTPVCFTSLTARLTPWDRDQDGQVDTAHALIWASEFDRSSSPACGDDSLEFRVEILDGIDDETAAGDDSFIELGCDHIGTQLIRLWVISQPSGTIDYCDIVLIVQSDFSGCGNISDQGNQLTDRKDQNTISVVAQYTQDQDGPVDQHDLRVRPMTSTIGVNKVTLQQNYPNPFKDETVVTFNLPRPMKAILTIYDINGRIIKEFENNYSKGEQQITLSKAQLTNSSIMFYRLQTDDGYSEIKRMILIN
ncbi:MAG: T9SS type A sorting domain-containing protein, partial [Saprospiraceae bacterium]|nr:T9SS type A sorting domain-containing protein [Saprospiraceae bacterium]